MTMQSEKPRCTLPADEQAELLLDYCAGRLDADRSRVFEAHMAVCPVCRCMCDEQQLVWNSLDQWEARTDESAFDRCLRERLEGEPPRGWLGQVREWCAGISWKPALPVVAGLALWMVLYTPPTAAPQLDASLMKPDVVKAEHVERVLEDVDMLAELKLTAR